MSPYETEHVKFVAGALDRASTACFTVGVATPVAGFIYNVGGFAAIIDVPLLLLGLAAWLLAAVALHYMGRRVLKGLDQ